MRQSPKLVHHKDPDEVRLWADKVERRFPCLPVWSIGVFFSGVISVGQKVPHIVMPEHADGFLLTHLKATFQAGTLTASTTLDCSKISKGDTKLLGTVTLLQTDIVNKVYGIELSVPVPLAANDILKWDCTATGAHEAVTAVVSGRQET